jgi:hypothetical protein
VRVVADKDNTTAKDTAVLPLLALCQMLLTIIFLHLMSLLLLLLLLHSI